MGGKQIASAPAEDVALPQQYEYHSYTVRGFARISKSGKALNITIKENGELHLMTISKMDIIDAFENGTQCCIIEYKLSDKEKQELKKNGD